MDLLLDRSFQCSVPLKVPTLKSGKKGDPSLRCTDIGREIMYRRFPSKISFYKWPRITKRGMSEEFNLVKRGYTRTETSSRLFQCSESVNTELMNVFAIEHNYQKLWSQLPPFDRSQKLWYWSPGLNTALASEINCKEDNPILLCLILSLDDIIWLIKARKMQFLFYPVTNF